MQVLVNWLLTNWVEGVGYLGTAFTIATYAMKTMVPLRIAVIEQHRLHIIRDPNGQLPCRGYRGDLAAA